MRKIRMLDLAGEFKLFESEIRAAIDAVLDSQHFIGGPAIAQLEREISSELGVKHAVAVSNGTDALVCALMALDIGHGDEVIIPSFTFFATAGSVWRVGARPVFVDIDPRTFNMDPTAVAEAITPRTRAIMPVHLFGQCADMDGINTIAKRHALRVIEDAAQAIGAEYRGRKAGAIGDLACLSFYPTKNLGGFGEGGMVLTNDDDLGLIVRQLRSHGESQRYVHERVGANFRLDTMKAAILSVKLRFLDEFTCRRRTSAALYDELLTDAAVTRPFIADQITHVYHQYSILCEHRDDLITSLRERGVETGVYYPVPLHLQKCFAELGYARGDLPITESICERILSLPVHPMLTSDDIEFVASCVRELRPNRARTIAAAR